MDEVWTPSRQGEPVIIIRPQALEEFEAILPLDSPARVLNVYGEAALGKTAFLKGLQKYCQEHGFLYNHNLIDFYDTAHHKVSGVIASIIRELDPEKQFFASYLELRSEFDRRRAEGYGGHALEPLGHQMDQEFLQCLHKLGEARRTDGRRGVVLLFDTFEMVERWRVGRWLLEDLVGLAGAVPAATQKDERLAATEDIVVVIAGRHPIDPEGKSALVRPCEPGKFSREEIAAYVGELFDKYGDVAPSEPDRGRLVDWIYRKTGGQPLTVSLALDIAVLFFSMPPSGPLSAEKLLYVLEDVEKGGGEDLDAALIEQAMELLRTNPDQLWAVLYMAHLWRRFTRRLYAHLQGKPVAEVGDLSTFANLHMVKYRPLGGTFRLPVEESRHFEESSVSLHDLVRDKVRQLYWEGGIPSSIVEEALGGQFFSGELADLWKQTIEQGQFGRIPGAALEQVRKWLDGQTIEYYKARCQDLLNRQEQVDRKKTPERWVEYEYQRYTLIAEQLLYELDQDLEHGWQHWRQEYYEAFEACRQGFCEQLELTIANAWPEEDLDSRRKEILDMVEVRRYWWFIRHSKERRQEAIKELERLAAQGESSGFTQLCGDVYTALGWAYWLEGDTLRSIQYREQALKMYRDAGLHWEMSLVLTFLGECYSHLGNFDMADRAWHEAMVIARDRKDRYMLASTAMKAGHSFNLRGESGKARGYARLAEDIFRQEGHHRVLAMALNYSAAIYLATGDYELAEKCLQEAEELCQRSGGPGDQISVQIRKGELYRRRAKAEASEAHFEEAKELLGKALSSAQQGGSARQETWAKEELGALYRDWANLLATAQPERAKALWSEAEKLLQEALSQRKEEGGWFAQADLLDDLCDLYAAQHRAGFDGRVKLEQYLAELDSLARKYGFARYLCRTAMGFARLAWEDGKYREAIEHYVNACVHAGMTTATGERGARTAYDLLVQEIEQRLSSCPRDEDKVELAQLAVQLWGRSGQSGVHPQFTYACQRVLYPAQARLYEQEADRLFIQGQKAYEGQDQAQADSLFAQAFERYVRACDSAARLAEAAFDYYRQYIALTEKLRRQLYLLPSMDMARKYSQEIEKDWWELGQAQRHQAVLDVCRNVQESADLSIPS